MSHRQLKLYMRFCNKNDTCSPVWGFSVLEHVQAIDDSACLAALATAGSNLHKDTPMSLLRMLSVAFHNNDNEAFENDMTPNMRRHIIVS